MTDGAGNTGPGTPGPAEGAPSGSPGQPPGRQEQPERAWQAPDSVPADSSSPPPASLPPTAPPAGGPPPAAPPNPPSGNVPWNNAPAGWGTPILPAGSDGRQAGPAGPPPGGWGGGQWGGPGGWNVPPPAPKPGVIPLRPLGVGEILDGTFSTIRSNPAATIGVTLATAAVVEAVNTVVSIAAQEASDGVAIVLTLVTFGLYMMLSVFLSGLLSVVVSEATLGRKITVGEATSRVAPRLLGLLGLTVIVTILTLLGLVAVIVGAIVVAVYLGLATPAYVLEGGTVGQALRRSVRLVRGAWWRTFGIMLLATGVSTVLTLIFAIPTSIILASSEETFGSLMDGDLTTAGHIVNAVGSLLATTLATPVLAGAIALLYVDRRIRREGLDVTLAAAARQRSATPGQG